MCGLDLVFWNLHQLRNYLNSQSLDLIRAIPPPNSSKSDDQLSWIGSGDCNNMKHDSSFSVVWRWRGPERIQVLLWKIMMNNK